jgi:hypothetical protein
VPLVRGVEGRCLPAQFRVWFLTTGAKLQEVCFSVIACNLGAERAEVSLLRIHRGRNP